MADADDITFDVADPRSQGALWAMRRYFAELDDRFPGGFDTGDALTADAGALEPPSGVFLLASIAGDEKPVGCGGLQTIGEGVAEIKRMWVDPSVRGRGVARRLLAALEGHARGAGFEVVRLDTNSRLPEAVALYRSAGYREIDRYNENPYPDHFFEKAL
jgi:GNAT superfamily N-acetyltransferase